MSQLKPTVCFAGTRLEALKSIQRFADVTSIITAPGSWVHSQRQPGGPPMELIDKNRKDEAFRFLTEQSVDLVISAGFPLILPPSVLQSGPVFLNSHPSLLPAYKGYHPITQAFENREEYMGVTVHRMAEEVDAGPVIHQERVWVKGLELPQIYDLLFGVVEPMALTRSLQQVLQQGM
jgi:folate-dependent phosphoribosylglycinamide formyltransferase PurN